MKKRTVFLHWTVISLLTLICCAAQAEEDKLKPATLEDLKTAISAVIEEKEVPAVGIAMVNEDGPVWIGAIGKANLENDVEADADTLFRIGSTSKMFVALSILRLVEEGRLSLDDRVADLAPEIVFENPWEATDPVRIVHLLEHTTGWDDIHLPEYAHNDPTPATLREGLDFHPHSRISRWVPGTRMSYCNSGPPVAAYIVEKITGQDFEKFVQVNFFDPMGMETMTYRLSDDVKRKGATLYDNGNQPQEYWHIIMRPSGSINASPRDMAKFLDFYLGRGTVDGRQLISAASLQRMETVKSTSGAKAGQESGYGLHNYPSVHEQWVYREHNGGVNGGITEFAYLPEAKLGHTIMTNSGDGEAFREISRLIRSYETLHLDAPMVVRERDVSAMNREIEGYYHLINPRQQVAYFLERVMNIQKLWFEEERLARKGLFEDETKWYFPVSDDLYKSADTGVISLSRTTDPLEGTVVHVNTGTMKPVSSFLVFLQLGIAALWGLIIASSLLFYPVWLLRRLRGKIAPGAGIRIRLWPLLAGTAVLLTVGLFIPGMTDPFKHLGAPTAISIGIMLSTLAFALFSLLGVYTSFKERQTVMNRGAYWHSTTASLVHFVLTVYFLSFGIIGLMTWA